MRVYGAMSQIDAPSVAARHVRLITQSSYRTARSLVASLAIGILCASCASAAKRPPETNEAQGSTHSLVDTAVASSARPSTTSAPSPLATPSRKGAKNTARSGTFALSVPDFEPAVLVVPKGSAALPLLVATHGAGGEPEWECERWGRVAKSRFVLLCPRGVPLRRGQEGSYFYPDHHALEREVTASVSAARQALGARLLPVGSVYVGYSQGATMGSLMLVDHGDEFSHLLLIEGGSADWTAARAARFRATGGQSVFIVCGTKPCGDRATRAKPVLERAGLRAEVRVVPDGGHTELGPVGDEAEKLLESLSAP